MGADLLLLGFVVDTEPQIGADWRKAVVDAEAGKAFIAALSDEALIAMADEIDNSGAFDDDEDLAERLRNALNAGCDEIAAAAHGHRLSAGWEHPISHRLFVTAGAASWGDDPFDGWSEMMYALNLCQSFHGGPFARALGVLSVGIGEIA